MLVGNLALGGGMPAILSSGEFQYSQSSNATKNLVKLRFLLELCINFPHRNCEQISTEKARPLG